MNYTKGEWKAEQDAANSIRIFSQDSEQIASVMDYDGNDITEEMEANAHLIAAAPDAYKELKEAYGMGLFDGCDDIQFNRIKQALAKAEGKD